MDNIEKTQTPASVNVFRYDCELKGEEKPSLKNLLNMHDTLKIILNTLKNEVEILNGTLPKNVSWDKHQTLLVEQKKLREESTKYTRLFNKVMEAMKTKVSEDFEQYFNENAENDEESILED